MFERPPGLDGGKVLILAGPDSFTASYVKRALALVDIPVTAPGEAPDAAYSRMDAEEWDSIIGCIAVDVGAARFPDFDYRSRAIPCLFVGSCCGAWLAGPYSWLCPPVASYQVVEALGAILPKPAEAADAMPASR